MKRLLIASLMSLCTLSLSAQRWVGGSLSMINDKNDHDKTITFKFNPEFGYQLGERWGVGVDLSLTRSTSEIEINSTTSKYKPYAIGLSPFVRYTLAETGKLRFFGDAMLNYEYTDGEKTYVRYANTVGAGLRLGATYDLTERLSLYSTLGHFGYDYTWSGGTHVGDFEFGLTSAVSIGLYVKF